MQHFFKQIYTLWCAIVFIGLFLLLFPFFLIIILVPAWHKHCYYLNKFWASVALFLVGIKTEICGLENLNPRLQYVFCANHFSLLDIVSFGFAPHSVVYVGKSSLAKVPLFGFMFKKLHVTVNRKSLKGRYKSLQQALEKMGNERSLVMFPEGGIMSRNIPEMTRFKDGAFRAAITKQIPLVPVTLPDNWIILPDEKIPLISRKKMRMIYHQPISTEGLTMDDVPSLKEKVFKVIAKELKKYH
ncbi:1-acyl-sn-glycerol-3-phosphate acyltransferase [Marivirga tractuosa]|uniref:Phospholipid/glycerol acyltransferase n=1 Tax=Marivirga tractuosa (strain ATCC 23168 / DSM 4126 / NBRC 15989 / NCIMB 1408 / VKM B-1430 / H-43) TaxID=643867 RepID=E4TMK5_MARTH|nr:lysophospholipid acyltransferase family protein [Marivirga tractuosa]ADR23439.1 phospholipid/glycerol acyltransferase [Marivirga tractuosa DSM 4126]BDD15884.1 1-acyl-sn-glycerol-3-phosphate acyltransferase [Marivirga tractuosa]